MPRNAGCDAMGFAGVADVTDVFGNAAGGDDDALGIDNAILLSTSFLSTRYTTLPGTSIFLTSLAVLS